MQSICRRLCRRNADETDDPSRKQHYLDMEARWRHLASNAAFLEQISNFNAVTRRRPLKAWATLMQDLASGAAGTVLP
jgi:hypothetical protein